MSRIADVTRLRTHDIFTAYRCLSDMTPFAHVKLAEARGPLESGVDHFPDRTGETSCE